MRLALKSLNESETLNCQSRLFHVRGSDELKDFVSSLFLGMGMLKFESVDQVACSKCCAQSLECQQSWQELEANGMIPLRQPVHHRSNHQTISFALDPLQFFEESRG